MGAEGAASGQGRILSLAAGVLPEFTPEQTAGAAAEAGFPAVGIWVDPKTWTAATARGVRARTRDAGLEVLDVEVVWIRPGPEDPDHLRIIEAGAEIGARNLLVVSSEPDPAAAPDRFARICDQAEAHGLRASLEFGAFTAVRDLSAALDLLDRADRPGAGLLVDPLHFARTGGAPGDLARVEPGRFAYAQYCDARSSGPHPDDTAGIIREALDLRLLPGEGALPLGELLSALPPGLPLSVELRSEALRTRWPDPADRARAVLAATRASLERLQGEA